MNYDELINEAIRKDEMTKLLCGIKPYEVEVSEFTSDVFPTDVNAVLVNCIYKKKPDIEDIDDLFVASLKKMIAGEAYELYTAILYFDACIFQEERKKATFEIGKEVLAEKIKKAVMDKRSELENTIVFDNGLSKDNAMQNVEQAEMLRKYRVEGVPTRFDDEVVVAKNALESRIISLQRYSNLGKGASGWCIEAVQKNESGEFRPVSAMQYESMYAYQLLSKRPAIVKSLVLPYNYLVVFDDEEISEILNDHDESVM